MRIATWNVNSLRVRMERVEEWLAYAQPDVLCLQETKLADSAFPAMAFAALGYESFHWGQGQWNGVAILSRVGIDDVVIGFGPNRRPEDEARLLWASCAGVRVASVYVPNGRLLGSEHYEEKLRWFQRLRDQLATWEPADPLTICGDYNVAPEDRDVWDVSRLHGATHVSPAEREAVGQLINWGLVDAFRKCHPEAGLYSWWDYRAGDFHQHRGLRIDLILATEALANRASFALIDRTARKGKAPSDHAPVLVDFE
ncbi:MAG: exodeoxyribonuclease III [Acidimicrobiales bacterium]